MASFIHKPTKTTPLVWFDPAAGTCVIAGQSLPENAPEFFGRLTDALDTELAALSKPLRWEFRLPYFNTSSTKGLYQVLARIKSHSETGVDHQVIWDVEADDEFMREAGENFEELLGLGITFREISEEQASKETIRLLAALEEQGS